MPFSPTKPTLHRPGAIAVILFSSLAAPLSAQDTFITPLEPLQMLTPPEIPALPRFGGPNMAPGGPLCPPGLDCKQMYRRLDHLSDFGGRLRVPEIWTAEPQGPIWEDEFSGARELIHKLGPDSPYRARILAAYPGIGGAEWFDDHLSAARGYYEAIQAAGLGAQFDRQATEERAYLSAALALFIPTDGGAIWTRATDFPVEDVRALFAVRALQDYGGKVAPPPRLTLSLDWRDLPPGKALAWPVDEAATAPFRQVGIQATLSEGSDIPRRIRFRIESNAPFTMLDPVSGCETADATGITTCLLPGGVETGIRVELNAPARLGDTPDTEAEADLRISAAAALEAGGWSPEAEAVWSLPFRRCDRAFEIAARGLPWSQGRSSGFRDAIRRASAPLEGVARARLHPGPSRSATPLSDTKTRDMPVDPESVLLGARITGWAENGARDDYLAGDSLYSLLREAEGFATLKTCDPTGTDSLFGTFDTELATMRQEIDRLREVQRDTEAGARTWGQFATIEWALIHEPVAASGDLGKDLGAQVSDTFGGYGFDKAMGKLVGPEIAGILGAPAALFSMVDLAIASGDQLVVLNDALAFRDTLAEASAWREAEVFAEVMLARYELAASEVETALALMRMTRDGACTCFTPDA